VILEGAREAGRIALEEGRLAEARRLLERALAEAPDDTGVRADLGWALYRSNDFAAAAEAFAPLPQQEAFVEKLRSFAEAPPYEIRGPDETELLFLQTDPLPVVPIAVQGRRAYAFIDTGGAELILDTEFAAEVGATVFGNQDGRFAGGRRAAVGQGRVESVALGDIELSRVPVHILPTRRFSGITEGRHTLDAVIGTNLLAQFRATLDYPGARLVLERPESAGKAVEGTEVAFTMLRDHYMLSNEGWLNGVGPLRFFVDSGLAGGAFTCPARTLALAGIAVPEATGEGLGGGGGVATAPFLIEELGLGALRQRRLAGLYIRPAEGEPEGAAEWDGIISHGFLRAYRWTIDAARSRFVFS
jgi:hypothetical protein